MSREGPINFGKPLLYLTIVGCIGGGIYLWKTWPSRYETSGWLVDFPTGWTAAPFEDPNSPGKVVASGPLMEEGSQGVAWVTVNYHGTLDWPRFVLDRLPGSPDTFNPDDEIGHKKTMTFEYQDDKNFRYIGAATQRGDAVVIVAIGAPVPLFDTNRARLEKCVKSLRVMR